LSSDLPKILSDDEFEKLLQAREKATRAENDRWDNSGVRPVHQASDGLPECCIEQQFPHIAKKLTVVWPSEACALYIADLIVNTRGSRQGFPPEILEDLLMLHEINDMLVRAANGGRRADSNPAPFSDTDALPRRNR
jgi:hypothetical protein